MKKLILLFLSLVTLGSLFQACDNSKTYAEQLDDEKNAVSDFIKSRDIRVISREEFEKDTITDTLRNEYVAFANGVYMQIVNRGVETKADTFRNNDVICVRYIEENIMARKNNEVGKIISWNVVYPGYEDTYLYADPLVFRYSVVGKNLYGSVTEACPLWSYGASIPSGWLLALPYLRDRSHVRLIVPSKMGHSTASKGVIPYYYDIQNFQKW